MMLTRKFAFCCTALALIGTASAPLSAESLEQRVQVLERQIKALSGLVPRLEVLQREVQQLRGEVELQGNAMSALKKQQRDLYLDLDGRLSRSPDASDAGLPGAERAAASVDARTGNGSRQAGKDQPAAPVRTEPRPLVVATSASAKEESAYQKAFELLTQRRYDESAKAVQNFLAAYPAGVYSDNAQYWLGETSYVTRDFDNALVEFNKLLDNYPTSQKVSGALLKIGYIQYEKQDRSKARATLASLIERYPGSSAARLAEEFMRRKKL
jgi:tol-pal system protein YbgF